MTKVLNFALKIKRGGRDCGTCEVLRPCQPLPPKFGTCTVFGVPWFCNQLIKYLLTGYRLLTENTKPSVTSFGPYYVASTNRA